jgi:hypothetical protein
MVFTSNFVGGRGLFASLTASLRLESGGAQIESAGSPYVVVSYTGGPRELRSVDEGCPRASVPAAQQLRNRARTGARPSPEPTPPNQQQKAPSPPRLEFGRPTRCSGRVTWQSAA